MNLHEAVLRKKHEENVLHTGLTEKEAVKKLKEHGLNVLSEGKRISAFQILLSQFSDFMVIILLASTAISAFMGELTEAITIIAIVVLNAILGFIQEFRTEKTMDALKGLAAPLARVVRGGVVSSIPAEYIVPGDIIVLEAGDKVPADGILLESTSFHVDESLLTGESVPAEKKALKSDGSIKDTGNKAASVYMGTVVTSGRSRAVVMATGMKTEMGGIASMIQNIEADETPLQKKLDHLGKFIVAGCLAICAVVAITGILRGEGVFNMLLAGISLAVAAVPEGLPAIVTVALALGVQRMLKRKALVRKLPAVETLGCAGVICSDKTGTLTENRMTVRKVFSGGESYVLSQNKTGSFAFAGRQGIVEPMKIDCLRQTLEIGALCNNASLSDKSKAAVEFEGDPTEGALLVAAAKGGFTRQRLDNTWFRIGELPFDSDRKCMSVVCDNHKGETYVFTKGAPDVIIKKCARIFTPNGEITLTPALKTVILRQSDSFAGDALRVLGMAYKKLGSRTYKPEDIEQELVFSGLSGMIDPPRKEALDAVRRCKMAGIRPIMITGDHKLTAAAIATELEILDKGGRVLTGTELDAMDPIRLQKEVEKVSVFARVSPRHKLGIVKALKGLGHVVAMTGDGVNDAPAVKEADIGVSMGLTGTDVTREASSMILLDDNFATIVAAIEEGRVIYNNIRKFIRYMLACNIGEVLTMFIGMLVGMPVPLLPIQILWVNLATDGLPAVALGFDPPEKDIMLQPPRNSKDSVFSHGLLTLILFRGVLIGITTLLVFAGILYINGSLDAARTGAFTTLVLTQLIHVFECKSESRSIFDIPLFNNLYLVGAVLCSLIMMFCVLYIPVLQGIFKTVPLSLTEWVMIGGLCALGPVISSFFNFKKR